MKNKKRVRSSADTSRVRRAKFFWTEFPDQLREEASRLWAMHGLNWTNALPFIIRWAVQQQSITPEGIPSWPEIKGERNFD
jgi:hypothetical protein